MNRRALVMLGVLIHRFHAKSKDDLLRFLPKEEAEAVTKEWVGCDDLNPLLQQPQNAMAKIHYSWIAPVVEQFPEPFRLSAIASLTQEQAAGLTSSAPSPVSTVAKAFFLNQFYVRLDICNHLPAEYLPETDLKPLLRLKKLHLMGLMDFLGLHDLSLEMRSIVDANKLKNIYACLTPKQVQYVKWCLTQKEQLVSPKLGIDLQSIDSAVLMQAVHKRGVIRLAKALCGQPYDLVWNLAHTLDTGRGTILLNEYTSQENPKVTNLLRQQVLGAMEFLKNSR